MKYVVLETREGKETAIGICNDLFTAIGKACVNLINDKERLKEKAEYFADNAPEAIDGILDNGVKTGMSYRLKNGDYSFIDYRVLPVMEGGEQA